MNLIIEIKKHRIIGALINYIDLMLDHYKHADSSLIKVKRAKALKEELNRQL